MARRRNADPGKCALPSVAFLRSRSSSACREWEPAEDLSDFGIMALQILARRGRSGRFGRAGRWIPGSGAAARRPGSARRLPTGSARPSRGRPAPDRCGRRGAPDRWLPRRRRTRSLLDSNAPVLPGTLEAMGPVPLRASLKGFMAVASSHRACVIKGRIVPTPWGSGGAGINASSAGGRLVSVGPFIGGARQPAEAVGWRGRGAGLSNRMRQKTARRVARDRSSIRPGHNHGDVPCRSRPMQPAT